VFAFFWPKEIGKIRCSENVGKIDPWEDMQRKMYDNYGEEGPPIILLLSLSISLSHSLWTDKGKKNWVGIHKTSYKNF